MIIGITGPIASGKSSLARIFDRTKAYYHFDCDSECKRISIEQKDGIEKIFGKFGYSNLTNAKIAKIIFSNPDIYKAYTDYIYFFLIEDFNKVCKENRNVVVDGINLYIFKDNLDIVFYVSTNPIKRFFGMLKRDHKKHTLLELIKKFFAQKNLFRNYSLEGVPVVVVKGKYDKYRS